MFGSSHEKTAIDWRPGRFWILLEKHDADCLCPRCVPDQAKIVRGWPAGFTDRWFGAQVKLPPQRGVRSWYTLAWSWRNTRFYLRIVLGAKLKDDQVALNEEVAKEIQATGAQVASDTKAAEKPA